MPTCRSCGAEIQWDGEWWIVSCRCGYLRDVDTAEEASNVVAYHSCSEWLEVDRAMVREMEGS